MDFWTYENNKWKWVKGKDYPWVNNSQKLYSNYQRKANYKTKFKKTFINYKRRGNVFKQIKGELGESTFFLNLIGIKLLRELENKDADIEFKNDELKQLKSDYKDLEKRLEDKPDLLRIHLLEKEISKHIQKEKSMERKNTPLSKNLAYLKKRKQQKNVCIANKRTCGIYGFRNKPKMWKERIMVHITLCGLLSLNQALLLCCLSSCENV